MTFKFLDLPAELRNRIYEIVATPDKPLPAILHKARCNDGNYAGLTRASTQIRKEYHPIQLRKAEILLNIEDLVAYTETFNAVALDSISLPHKILVQVPLIVPESANLRFDIAPLLKLKAADPTMESYVVPGVVSESSLLYLQRDTAVVDALSFAKSYDIHQLVFNSNERWLADIRNGIVGAVWICPSVSMFLFEIEFVGVQAQEYYDEAFANLKSGAAVGVSNHYFRVRNRADSRMTFWKVVEFVH